MSLRSLRYYAALLSAVFWSMWGVIAWGLLDGHGVPASTLAGLAALPGSLGAVVACAARGLAKRRSSEPSERALAWTRALAGMSLSLGNVFGLILVTRTEQAVAQKIGLALCAAMGGFLLATIFFAPDPAVAAVIESQRLERPKPVKLPLLVMVALVVTVVYFMWMAVRQ